MTSNAGNQNQRIPLFLLKTRSTPNDGYQERFSTGQFVSEFVPVLEHQLLDDGLDVVRQLLRNKEIGGGQDKRYGGLIFTSQRAVEAFAKLVDEGKGTRLACLTPCTQ